MRQPPGRRLAVTLCLTLGAVPFPAQPAQGDRRGRMRRVTRIFIRKG
jgi:hypothetical protein